MFTNIHVRFLPIALCIIFATTLLSTPPDNAQITLECPTCVLISSIIFSYCFFEDQFFFDLQIENKKFFINFIPLCVWVTSG